VKQGYEEDLIISSLGMISSVGHDVINACAAIRAGFSRPALIDYYSLLDEKLHEPIALVGFPVQMCTEGFCAQAAWLRLAISCMHDLLHYGNLPGKTDKIFWERTGLVGALPHVSGDRFHEDEKIDPAYLKEAVLNTLLESMSLSLRDENVSALSVGHAGTVYAVSEAQKMIEEHGLDRVIVLAVDSYLDPLTLEWLGAHERLKSDDNPQGLVPGEAAAAFMIEKKSIAEARGARIEAVITAPACGVEVNHLFSDYVNNGRALSAVIKDTLARSNNGQPFTGIIIPDLNGENWRAMEYGSARAVLCDRISDDAFLITPCASLGDTGAASGSVAFCIAVRAFARHYLPDEQAMILSSSEYGAVGSVILKEYNPSKGGV